MNKQVLRALYKEKRVALDTKQRLVFDDLLLLQFQQFNYEAIQTVLSYWPISAMAEPNTHLFTGYLRHLVPGLLTAYPVANQQTNEFTALAVHENTIYQTNQWGITEPKEGAVVAPESIDLVLVPMLICDTSGYRVGYGKGFYDRYLAHCRKDIVKIGFSYFDPVEKINDTDQFDVPLTYCITPQRIYEF